MDKKLEKIEEIVTHQERQIQDLSDMVKAQWQEIDALKRHLKQAHHKITALESSVGENSASVSDIASLEKPPHY